MARRDTSRAIKIANEVRRGVLYARVSSKEQEREGFSIPAQLKLLREYAAAQNVTIVEEFVDVETAKQSGRVNFEKMVKYLRRHSTVRILLVERVSVELTTFSFNHQCIRILQPICFPGIGRFLSIQYLSATHFGLQIGNLRSPSFSIIYRCDKRCCSRRANFDSGLYFLAYYEAISDIIDLFQKEFEYKSN